MVVDPSTIVPGSDDGAEVSLVATWTTLDNTSEFVTLTVGGTGVVTAAVDESTGPVSKYQWRYSNQRPHVWTDWKDIPGSDAATATFTVEGLRNDVARHSFEVRPYWDGIGVGDAINSIGTPDAQLTWQDQNNPEITKFQFRHTSDTMVVNGRLTADWETNPNQIWRDIDGSGATTTGMQAPNFPLSAPIFWEVRPFTTEGLPPIDFTVDASVEFSWTPVTGAPPQYVGFGSHSASSLGFSS